MSKIAVVYWSGTGNTEIMANKIVEGVTAAGNTADLFVAPNFSAEQVAAYDVIALGCPAMGAEVLEECDFQPMYDDIQGALNGKSVALFGSYGWGSGEWMNTWQEDTEGAGANLVCESLMLNETPDDEGEAACVAFGKALS